MPALLGEFRLRRGRNRVVVAASAWGTNDDPGPHIFLIWNQAPGAEDRAAVRWSHLAEKVGRLVRRHRYRARDEDDPRHFPWLPMLEETTCPVRWRFRWVPPPWWGYVSWAEWCAQHPEELARLTEETGG